MVYMHCFLSDVTNDDDNQKLVIANTTNMNRTIIAVTFYELVCTVFKCVSLANVYNLFKKSPCE